MKKVVLVAMLAVLALPAAVMAASTFDGLQEGTYSAIAKSPAVKDMDGAPVNLTLKKVGNDYQANVTFKDGSKETWTFNDTKLIQSEDAPNGLKYTANKATATPNSVTYSVNCADAKNKKCDAGIDNRAQWTLVKEGNNGLTYKYFGVSMKDSFNTAVNPSERFVIPFKYTATKPTTATAPAATTAPAKKN